MNRLNGSDVSSVAVVHVRPSGICNGIMNNNPIADFFRKSRVQRNRSKEKDGVLSPSSS